MNKFLKFYREGFVKDFSVLSAGGIIAALLNFLFYLVAGRSLPAGDFGELQAFASIYAVIAVFFAAFFITASNIHSNFSGDEKSARLAFLKKIIFSISISAGIFILIFQKKLTGFFLFRHGFLFWILAGLVVLSAFTSFKDAYLQGRGFFKKLSLSAVIYAGSKVFLAAILLWVGLGVLGAGIAMLAALTLDLIYLSVWAREDASGPAFAGVVCKSRPADGNFPSLRANFTTLISAAKKDLPYFFAVSAALACVNFFCYGDILFAKHYFDPTTAGLYIGISTVANAVFFIASPFFAIIIARVKMGGAENHRIFWKSFCGVCFVSFLSLAVFWFWGNFAVKILIGTKYLPLSGLIFRLGVLMSFASVLNIFFAHFLALRKIKTVFLLSLSAVVPAVLVLIGPKTVLHLTNSFIYGSAFSVVLSLVLHWYEKDSLDNNSGFQ